jgi:UrcA family protein
MRSPSVILCLASAGLLGPLTAQSAPTVTTVGADVATRVVRFGDLNLENHAGVVVLYSRIKFAAEEVCRPVVFRTSDTSLRLQRCTEGAIERAVRDVGSPQLTSFHMSKTHTVTTAQVR